eukprot:1472167-Pyramimonas_sp.AAC.1
MLLHVAVRLLCRDNFPSLSWARILRHSEVNGAGSAHCRGTPKQHCAGSARQGIPLEALHQCI